MGSRRLSDEDYEREMAYVQGMLYAAKILRDAETKTIGHTDPSEAVAWHRKNLAMRIELEARRIEKDADVDFYGDDEGDR